MQITMLANTKILAFYETIKNQKLSMKTAYKLAQLNKAAQEENNFFQEKLQTIIAEYGEINEAGQPIPTEDGRGIKLKPGTEPDCYTAMQELYELEVALPDILFDIEEFSNVELSADEIGAIIPFIKD